MKKSREIFCISCYNVTIHSRFRMGSTCVVLARKHLLSILNQDCEAVTPPS